MPARFGDDTPTTYRWSDDAVSKLYFGDDQIWAPAPTIYPVTFQAVSSTLINNNSFNMNLAASGAFDTSAYAGVPNLALVVALNWYANGGGPATFTCTYNGVNLTMMVGNDRSSGASYGTQLWIMQNPPIGNFTLLGRQVGTSNTGRNIMVGASLWSNVSSWEAGNYVQIGSGVSHTIAVGPNEVAVNAMAAGQNMSNYSQTERHSATVGGTLRGRAGDAYGDSSGSKSFTMTGGTFNSVLARLLPVIS